MLVRGYSGGACYCRKVSTGCWEPDVTECAAVHRSSLVCSSRACVCICPPGQQLVQCCRSDLAMAHSGEPSNMCIACSSRGALVVGWGTSSPRRRCHHRVAVCELGLGGLASFFTGCPGDPGPVRTARITSVNAHFSLFGPVPCVCSGVWVGSKGPRCTAEESGGVHAVPSAFRVMRGPVAWPARRYARVAASLTNSSSHLCEAVDTHVSPLCSSSWLLTT